METSILECSGFKKWGYKNIENVNKNIEESWNSEWKLEKRENIRC